MSTTTATTAYDRTIETPHHIIRLWSTASDLAMDTVQEWDAMIEQMAVDAANGDDLDSITYQPRADRYRHDLQWDVRWTPAGQAIAAASAIDAHEWDRHEWMALHGEWASSGWEDERAEYDHARQEAIDAVQDLLDGIQGLPDGDDVSYSDDIPGLDAVEATVQKLRDAAAALEDQVCVDESDYIAEGLIDPSVVSDTAVILDGVGESWQGWDCREGWDAYRDGDGLYMHWWREAWGDRHDRSLWVKIDPDFFAGRPLPD